MPQLMPLNWVFSVFIIFMIIMSACMMYSEKLFIFSMELDKGEKEFKSQMNWCW